MQNKFRFYAKRFANLYTREVITRDINENLKRWESGRNDTFHKLDYDSWEELFDWINKNRSSESTTATTAKPLVPVLPVINPKQMGK